MSGRKLRAAREGLRYALKMYKERRTTMKSLANAVDDYLAVTEAIATPPESAQEGDGEAARRYIRDWCPDHVKDYIDRIEVGNG